jgi:putative addiction module CopG family antidote
VTAKDPREKLAHRWMTVPELAERLDKVSEVVRAGLRLLEDQGRRRELELEKLRQSIGDGGRSGPPRPADEVLERLDA